jgi:hypothetical protein
MLKLSLVLAAAATVLVVAKREEGTLLEKLDYLGRVIFGRRHPSSRKPSLMHVAQHA